MHKFKGLKEIENWRQENEKKWSLIATYPINIEKEADTAHVKCFIFIEDLETGEEFIKLSCSTKMLKIGPTWKIREQIIKNRSK